MQFTKILCFTLSAIISMHSFAEYIWGTVPMVPMSVPQQGSAIQLAAFKDVLSVDENGYLDSSNKVKVDFDDRESRFPEMVLDSAEVKFITGQYAVKGCRGFNEDCSFLSLDPAHVANIINNSNISINVWLEVINHSITQTGASGETGSIWVKSNKTNNQYELLATYRIDIPKMKSCIGHMDSNVWDLGKISPASFATPRQMKIGSYGSQRALLKFKSNDLVNNVLTMHDGDRTGPSVEFSGKDWFSCQDNDPNAICAYIGASSSSADILDVAVNGINSEPGQYTSYLTSTIDCP